MAALERLIQIRRGFDYTYDDAVKNDSLRRIIEEGNKAFVEISPKLRLYATDKIFNQYSQLCAFSHLAYAQTKGETMLNSFKSAYDMQVTILARRMQDDLGYRTLGENYDSIECPECGRKHDMIGKCPNCGMVLCQDLVQNKMRGSAS